MAFIYVITNKINGKQYVGKTTHNSIQKRFQEHIRDSRKSRCEKRPLYSAINKYGVENFTIEQLEECSIDELEDREIYWIDKLDTYHNGYNATHGGDGKILYNYKEIADKYLELQCIAHTAKFFGCDVDTVKTACTSYGVRILSYAENAKKLFGKAIVMLDKDTEEILQYFSTITDAEKFIGKVRAKQHIREVALGKRKTAYGYKWRYVE